LGRFKKEANERFSLTSLQIAPIKASFIFIKRALLGVLRRFSQLHLRSLVGRFSQSIFTIFKEFP
jgi:hypothetical protein